MTSHAGAPPCTGGEGSRRLHCDYAWLGGERARAEVTLELEGGRIAGVRVGTRAPKGAVRLRGLTLPGLVNAHSHAFHRALRARSERQRGDFWSWRQAMYATAEALTPERYHALARAVYAEMALAGITAVGEFHYLHHASGGVPYADPNEMGKALLAAGDEAGVRVVLIDACYLENGPGRPLEGVQRRFGDGGVEAWAERASALAETGARVGAAIHSLRAVPPEAASRVAAWAGERRAQLHFHCSEQRAENDQVAAAYGRSPVELLAEAGALGPCSVAVHATHVDLDDAGRLGATSTGACLCPTTERDLGDGIGPARRLGSLGSSLSLGTDSQAVVDLFEEMRTLELDERLASERRGHFSAEQLLEAATAGGARALGLAGAGRLGEGAPADLVTISLEGTRLAGVEEDFLLEGAVFAAAAGDVTDVVVAGRSVVAGGRHLLVEDVASKLRRSISELRRGREGGR